MLGSFDRFIMSIVESVCLNGVHNLLASCNSLDRAIRYRPYEPSLVDMLRLSVRINSMCGLHCEH
jgi:hypothetical protein